MGFANLVLALSCVFLVSQSINFSLLKGEKRVFRWNAIHKENLVIEANFETADKHTIVITVLAGDKIIFGTTSQAARHLKKTITNPFGGLDRTTQQHYFIQVECQSALNQQQPVWNLVSLKLTSDFKDIINHNTKREHSKKHKQKRKSVHTIGGVAEEIRALAAQHQQMQARIREEENKVQNEILDMTNSHAYMVITEIAVVSLCALLQVISFRRYIVSKYAT